MQLKQIKGLGTAVMILIGAQLLLVVPEAFALLHRINLLDRYISGDFSVTISDLQSADSSVEGISGFTSLVFLATVVCWMIWQHRAQYNARQFSSGLRFTPGWAVGWWFIPFANLVMPFKTMRELWKASHGGNWQAITTWPVIGFWWGLYLMSNFSIWVSSSSGSFSLGDAPIPQTATPADVVAHDRWAIISLVLRIVAGVLAIVLVRAITDMQQAPPAVAVPGLPTAPSSGDALPPPPPPMPV